MLRPAILYKDQIQQASYLLAGTDDMFYYSGWSENDIIHIDTETGSPWERRQFASVNADGELLGYISYCIDHPTRTAFQFGLMSFKKGNLTVLRDIDRVFEGLVADSYIHRIEWKMIGGNFVEKAYDKLCQKYGGRKLIMHDVVVDKYGDFHDDAIYEIIKGNRLTNERNRCDDY
jgi:hypothetical protein